MTNNIINIQQGGHLIAVVAGVLLIPLVAMQFSSNVVWTLSDFVVAAIALLVFGGAAQMAANVINNGMNKFIVIGLILVLFLLTWAELAVGIFETPFAGS